jgi:acyl-CoA hydrolase
METRTPADSLIVMTELVLPNDTNLFGNLMGGRLMYWMDIAAALSAGKHCNAPVVTASVDNISFESPIKLGNVVHIEARVTRAFNTSMEVHLSVWGEDLTHQYRYKSNTAYYTFVALDPNRKPRPVVVRIYLSISKLWAISLSKCSSIYSVSTSVIVAKRSNL